MIYKKKLKFNHNGIDFEAIVEFNDDKHVNILKSCIPIYYTIRLIKPINQLLANVKVRVGGHVASMRFALEKYKEARFVYFENEHEIINKYWINLYTLAKKEIIFIYFNKS